MKKILLVNAGSSSVKWKLFADETQKPLASGLVERIKMPNSIMTTKYQGKKATDHFDQLTYEAAADLILKN